MRAGGTVHVSFFAVRLLSCLSCFFFFFSRNIEARAPGRHEIVCCGVVRARGTAVHGWLFSLAVRFLLFLSWFGRSFVSLLATSKRVRQADRRESLSRRTEGGGTVRGCFLFTVRFLPCLVFCFVLFLPLHIEEGQRGLRLSFVHC